MPKVDFSNRAAKRFVSLPLKQRRQIAVKIRGLSLNPYPNDSAKLKGYPFHRVDIGEYRVIYEVEGETLNILVVGKRNDNQVYKEMKRIFG
jgi:mRNA interferase RelE/StbE